MSEEEDRRAEAAAARQRGQLDLFPSLVKLSHGKVQIRADHAQNAVRSILLKQLAKTVSDQELDAGLPSDNIFRLAASPTAVRFGAIDGDFQTWTSLKIRESDLNGQVGINIVCPKHYWSGLQRVTSLDRANNMILSFTTGHREIKLEFESTVLRMRAAPSTVAPTQASALFVHHKIPTTSLAQAIAIAEIGMNRNFSSLDRDSSNQKTSKRKSGSKQKDQASRDDFPVAIRNGMLLAGGMGGVIAVENPQLSTFSLNVSAANARKLERMLRRMDPAETSLYEHGSYYIISDKVLGCSFPKSSQSFPSIEKPLRAAPSHSFIAPKDIGLRTRFLSSFDPTQGRVNIQSNGATSRLTLKFDEVGNNSGSSWFEVKTLEGKNSEPWNGSIDPRRFQFIADFADTSGTGGSEAALEFGDQFVRVRRELNNQVCTMMMSVKQGDII